VNLFATEPVQVVSKQKTGVNGMNAPVYSWIADGDPVQALVSPGSTGDLDGSIRPDGVEVVYQLHWPKSDTRSLKGKRVEVRGVQYEVIGDPTAYTAANTPGDWNRPVQVKAVSG
jgi:hypothetical protein